MDKNFSGEVAALLGEISAMLEAKNSDYGGSVFQSCGLAPGLPVETAMFVRIGDKINRLKNLLGSANSQQTQESLDDTIRDLIGYLVCLLIWRQRQQEMTSI